MTKPKYCDKPSVNVLTSALEAYRIADIVLCPGARNAVLVHNFHIHPAFTCHAVTDERSAGFVALGIALRSQKPVALCVTSGSALLNLLPAVAEAYYRQIPLIVISADRPTEWINQNDGQTLPQVGALSTYVSHSVHLSEVKSDADARYCLRLLHEVMADLRSACPLPVHINVPLTEPLFSFTTPFLPIVATLTKHHRQASLPLAWLTEKISAARLPLLLMGQCDIGLEAFTDSLDNADSLLILPELISNVRKAWRTTIFEDRQDVLPMTPDLVIYVGGMTVGKGLKKYLRALSDTEVIRVGCDMGVIDTFYHTTAMIEATPKEFLSALATLPLSANEQVRQAKKRFEVLKEQMLMHHTAEFSDLAAFRRIAREITADDVVHLANSSSIRTAGYCLTQKPYACHANRGVNGIEGSLSAAVGYNVGCHRLNYCFIGDLSFFYDSNALWNTLPKDGLRVVLFNNGGGQIHRRLPGLPDSPALTQYIVAQHSTSAQLLAEAHGWQYSCAHTAEELEDSLSRWSDAADVSTPWLLEIFTHSEDNIKALEAIKKAIND